MLHELLPSLPDRLTAATSGVLAWAVLAGVLLWLAGARFSRSMLTLAAVASGALAGLRLPHSFHWSIDPMCTGVAGAIVFATAAYLLHRTLIAIGLGALLALWAFAATWIGRGGTVGWNPSRLHWSGDTVLYLTQLWQSLPGDLGRAIPYSCGAAFASGVLTGVMWPRLSRCLLYSAGGPTLAIATALPLVARLRPEWLEAVPASLAAQGAMLVGWVALGLAVQWQLSPEPAKGNAASEAKVKGNAAAPAPSRTTAAASTEPGTKRRFVISASIPPSGRVAFGKM